jgi:fermentation-respiration switch protein FrsA (DUF1100 family)
MRLPSRALRPRLALLASLALLVAGCGGGDGGGDGASDSGSDARFGVGTRFETFLDTSRGTDAKGDEPGKRTRTLETLVYYPAAGTAGRAGGEPQPGAPAAAARGPFPLIVFSHGSGVSSPTRYDLLFRTWAASGYVIAAPKYPLSSTSLPGAGGDVVNQPRDIGFVIDEMLRLSSEPTSPYHRLVDGDHIGVAGHSLGGVNTLGVAFNRCCVDPRIKAGAVMAGAAAYFPAEGFFDGIRTPLLVVHGDDDRVVRLDEGEKVFQQANPPKLMLTVLGGDHSRPYGGTAATAENPERLGAHLNEATRLVNATTISFFDRYLKDKPDAIKDLRQRLADEVNAKLQVVER